MRNFNPPGTGRTVQTDQRSPSLKLRLMILTLAFILPTVTQPDPTNASEPSPPDAAKQPGSENPTAAPSPLKLKPKKPEANSRTAEKSRKNNSDLDRQLLRDLLPDLSLDPTSSSEKSDNAVKKQPLSESRVPHADELDETVESMREVSRQLHKLSLSDETEQLQTGIVSNIDALIEKLRNMPPPPSASNSPDQSNPDQSDQKSSQDQQTGNKQQPQQTPQEQPGADSSSGTAPQPQSSRSGESTEQNLRQARERAAAMARRRALVDEVWGHLPPAMRERLLNVGSEKLLPKYEELIRRYYEALAEPDRGGTRR